MEENKILKNNTLRILLLFAFSISGMTALIYEVAWIRPLQLVFGSTIYSVSAMLTTLMIGFVLGSFLFRNIADRSNNPVRIFSYLQFFIGIYGFLIFCLFKILPYFYLSLLNFNGYQFFQFLLVFLVLIPPAFFFGATWPIVNKAYVNLLKKGEEMGRLYAFNSLGSGIGSLLAGFFLIPILGIMRTSFFAASLNLLIGIIFLIYTLNQNNK